MKQKKEYLLLDVDGVLLEWDDGFVSYMESIDKPPTTFYRRQFHNILNEYYDDILNFHRSHGFSRLEPLPNSIDVLTRLTKLNLPIIAITSCSKEDVVQENRIANLSRYFPMIEAVIFEDLGGSKTNTLSNFKNAFWVDDSITFSGEGAKVGHRTALMTRHHNVERELPDSVTRVQDWLELEHFIITNI